MRKDYRHLMAQVALTEQKKEEILTMLEQNENKTSKRRVPAATKIALAAALAVGCVLSIAAGLPAQVYNFVAGGQTVVQPGGEAVSFTLAGEESGPVTLENGRLMFQADGQKLDITGQVDENTPYVYEHTDPATGNKGYVVVGGTVDNYGWAEFFLAEDGTCSMQGQNYADSYLTIDGVRQPSYELSEELVEKLNHDPSYELSSVNHPWLDAALDQLSLKAALGIVD